jgi:hypothetical protein
VGGTCACPDTREQRCWFHKIANVLSALPKSAHPGAKKALAEVWNAEDREHALGAFKLAYGAKFGRPSPLFTLSDLSTWGWRPDRGQIRMPDWGLSGTIGDSPAL